MIERNDMIILKMDAVKIIATVYIAIKFVSHLFSEQWPIDAVVLSPHSAFVQTFVGGYHFILL